MPDDLRARIAAALRLHQWRATVRMTDDDPVLDCTCGMAFGPHHTFDCYREHVADAVIRELGLRTQTVAEAEKAFWGISLIHRDETDYRYVTDWKAK